jgi:hypothetical protein
MAEAAEAADAADPTDAGSLAKAVRRIPAAGRRVRPRMGRPAPKCGTVVARRGAGPGNRREAAAAHRAGPRRGTGSGQADHPVSWPAWPSGLRRRPKRCWSTPAGRCALRRPRPRSWPRPVNGIWPLARRRGQLRRAVNDLTGCWPRPVGSPPRPASASPGSCPRARPGGSACTTVAPADGERPAGVAGRVRLQRGFPPSCLEANRTPHPARPRPRPRRGKLPGLMSWCAQVHVSFRDGGALRRVG